MCPSHVTLTLTLSVQGHTVFYVYLCIYVCSRWEGAAVAEWLSSWLVEQEDRGSIPGLATWIFRDWLSPASKSRYGWKIAKSTLILKTTNQPIVLGGSFPIMLPLCNPVITPLAVSCFVSFAYPDFSFHLYHLSIFSSPEPKAQVSFCHSTPSIVRPSIVIVRKLSHFQLLLQNLLMEFDETW